MPIPTAIYTTGQPLIEAPYQADSVEQASQLEPEGIYTVARTYRGDHAILLDAHLDRLEESAQLEGIPLDLDRPSLRTALRTMIHRAGFDNARFRITIPRHNPDQIILALEPLQLLPEAIRQKGVAVAAHTITRHNPRAKTNNWLSQRTAARQLLPPEVYEGIIVNAMGELLEGFSSNFYAIKDDVCYTADKDILWGIARRIVLTVASEVLPIELKPVHLEEIPSLDEAFLTSSSRGVVPIVQINSLVIGDRLPGPITNTIRTHYDTWVEDHLEKI